MRYNTFTIHLREGDPATFTDVEGQVIYDLKFPDNGALLVEKCLGEHEINDLMQLPDGPIGTLHDLERLLKGKLKNALKHEHEFVVMYAPGTWVRVDFANA